METKIFIREVRTNPKTGHITLRLQSETTEGTATWTGPLGDYGVDADTFYGQFSGDIAQLEMWAASGHRAKIGIHAELADALAKRVGKQIEESKVWTGVSRWERKRARWRKATH